MIVVDTNIIAYFTFPNPNSPAVVKLHHHDPAWAAPLLWRSEFMNVIALYQRKKLINYTESLEAMDYAERIVGIHEHRISSKLVLELISSSNCSSYDCEFVALAQKLDTKLVTYDKNILLQFPTIASKPEEYLASFS